MKSFTLNHLLASCFFFLALQLYASDTQDTYALSLGKEDHERLTFLNEAVNPYSISFLKEHIKPGEKVLELGCGVGIMSQELAKIVGPQGDLLATDFSEEQINIAKSLLNGAKLSSLRFGLYSAYDLSSVKEKFDVVYMRFLLIHLKDPIKVLEQVRNVLKPKGRIIIEDLLGNDTIAAKPVDKRLELVKKIDQLQEEVQKTDFSIAARLKTDLPRNGFNLISYTEVHPILDTLNKRRNFSLGMKSLKATLLAKKKIKESELEQMFAEVQKMEEEPSVKLYFYKMAQIAAQLN